MARRGSMVVARAFKFDSVFIAYGAATTAAAMTAAMAHSSGVRVGLYTSPHLCKFQERIQISGEPVSESIIYPYLEEVLDRCPALPFFKTATVTAFLVFARQQI